MRAVGVNLLWLRPGVVGGSEEYLCRQLAGLAELTHDEDITLFGLPALARAHLELAARYPIVAPRVSGRSPILRVGVEATWLGRQVRRRRVALLHHGGGTAPVTAGARVVLTIHDLQYLRYPGSFGVIKRQWLRRAVPASARRADVIVVPSEYVRETVVEGLPTPPDRVVVAPHGLPTVGLRPPATPASVVRSRYGLPGRYVVYPAITHRHKNHVTLVRALGHLRSTHPDLHLVLLGGSGPAEADLRAEIARHHLEDRIVRPGRVPAADRDGLYAEAAALAFPSRYEGFGAPIIEAMAAGCPVVAARTTALPEVVGGAGLLVAPDDVDGWAEAIALILDDPAQADLLRQAGRLRAASFTAERSAAALLTAYGLALA